MRLPGADQAIIDTAKVRDYLLSSTHPVGRFKSAFFVSLGYSRESWEMLAAGLLKHAATQEALPTEASVFGQKYEVRGSITGPSGRQAQLVSVWIILVGESHPRLVTAYPGGKP